MSDHEIKTAIHELIANTAIGDKATISFRGLAVPIEIAMTFSGGWKIMNTLIPGKSFEFIKGKDGYLEEISITFLPHEGLK